MTMTTFSYRRRILGCEACGTAVEVNPGGGSVACTSCGAPVVVTARPNTAVPRSAPRPEPQRIQYLRQQDGRPLLPPPGLESLMQGGKIEPWRMQEARQIYTGTRRHLLSVPSDVAASERLLFLTMLLSNTLSESGNDPALRSLYEGSLEALSLPRHRQMMRGYLARHAARTNDFESAEAWLAGCDPCSDDLLTDSAYRVSRAFIDTGLGRYQNVVGILGASEQDVPIDDSMDPVAAVLRANAWERQGRPDAAQQQLARFMTQGQASTIEHVVKAMPQQWQVCAQSVQGARQAHRAHVGAKAGTAWIGWILLVSGFLPLLAIIPVILSGASIMMVAWIVIFPVIFGGLGLKMIKSANRAKKIAAEGLHGTARVLNVQPTGTEINNVPVMAIIVQVQVSGHPPVQAQAKKLLHHGQAGVLMNRELPCIWHPGFPTEVVLDI